MGNQLTGIAPSQILPVEHYLTDVVDYEFDISLGSTRFFKVARARHKEGLAVVKVFVIHDPSLPLKTYRDQLQDIQSRLQGASNCLPFQKATISDKAAGLYRQYVKDSLYDRISTRPFLSKEDKQWLAFQLLCALNQCHKLSVCHGDIKSENVMVTSWNWLLLADFASFKPTYLPEDNPADFSYFFDTSRRRTCYIAPERFVDSSWRNQAESVGSANIDLTDSEVKQGELTPAMDIFSVGCVIIEIFTEGAVPFDLSQLLAYRVGDYSPWKLLEKIDDPHVKDLVRHMIQKDPSARLNAEEYLVQQRDKAFPDYFYTFFKLYLQRFASIPIMTPDDRINRMKRDMQLILQHLNINEADRSQNTSLILVISVITSSLRNLKYCGTRLTSLELLLMLSHLVTADIILDRIIPFMLHLVNDSYAQVRAEAVRKITQCLEDITHVPVSDANIFPEYILPQMSHLTQDTVTMVRVAYAENIAQLADTALRFLEIVQLGSSADAVDGGISSKQAVDYKAGYDSELQTLQELVQQKVVTLLSDSDNIVKQTLLENGITRLCVFFGRQKANDVLLSHMITFLNDKYDWHLRAAFFSSIVGVASYVGWQSSGILKPLLQQGLGDVEETVIHKTLCAITSLTELGLLKKNVIHDMLAEVVPFFCHPNLWLRQGAVGFVSAVARTLNIADVHCNLLPLVEPYLTHMVLQLDQEVLLLSVLQPPVPRTMYDYLIRSSQLDLWLGCLQDRQLMRNLCRSGHSPQYGPLDDSMAQMMRKLNSQGLTPAHEDKILALKDLLLRLQRMRCGSSDSTLIEEDPQRGGKLDLASVGKGLIRRHADLIRQNDMRIDGQTVVQGRRRKPGADGQGNTMNEDWKQMFGSNTPGKVSGKTRSAPGSTAPQNIDYSVKLTATPSPPESVSPPAGHKSSSPSTEEGNEKKVTKTITVPAEEATKDRPGSTRSSPSRTSSETTQVTKQQSTTHTPMPSLSMSQLQASVEGKIPVAQPMSRQEKNPVQVRYSGCKIDLHQLVLRKREEFSADQVTQELLDSATWERRPPPSGWRPRGHLVAHLHEHRGAVNRIQVNHDHSFFASCSNDGSVKVFDCSRMEGKSVSCRSRFTYSKQGGQIKTITFCESSQSIASASDSGSIHVFRLESGSGPRVQLQHTRNMDIESEGMVVDMTYFDTGSQNVVTYATVHGLILGWDLRAPRLAWQLQNNNKHGLITSFDAHPLQSWLAVGTSSGKLVCWDMRFQLPTTTVPHPTDARVRRLLTHPTEQSCILASFQGNNEISLWDMETAARQKTLWASTAPALSRTQVSSHSVNGLYLGITDSNMFLLAGGSDMRLRYWDLTYPANSQIIVGAASDPPNQTAVSYRSRLIDGTEVVQETYGKPRPAATDDIPRRGPDAPPAGHHDIITDVNICQTAQCFVVTSSRDGVIKVWK